MGNPADDERFVLSFVLLSDVALPEPARVCAAAEALGIEIRPDPTTDGAAGDVQFYDGDAGRVMMLVLVDRPHPEAGDMCYGVFSPDADEAAAAPAHLVLSSMSATESVRERDLQAVKLTAAVVQASRSVGAMLGHCTVFQRAEAFQDLDADCSPEMLPLEFCVDFTFGREDEATMSILSHGMARYGREDLYVFGNIEDSNEVLEFAMTIANWLLCDPDTALPTGDTVGRDADEKVEVQRGPSPIDEDRTVMILRLV